MSEQANIVEQGRERIQEIFQSVEDEFTKVQKRVEERRSEFNDHTEKQLKKFQARLRKFPAYKRAETLSNDVSKQIEQRTKQFEESVESTLDSGLGYIRSTFRIASRDEVRKLEKKLDRVSRRISSLDKAVNQSQ